MNITAKIEVRIAWWWTWLYLPGVKFLIDSGMEPDMSKVSAMAERAVRIKIIEVTPNDRLTGGLAATEVNDGKQ